MTKETDMILLVCSLNEKIDRYLETRTRFKQQLSCGFFTPVASVTLSKEQNAVLNSIIFGIETLNICLKTNNLSINYIAKMYINILMNDKIPNLLVACHERLMELDGIYADLKP